jgi:hypothetical protein
VGRLSEFDDFNTFYPLVKDFPNVFENLNKLDRSKVDKHIDFHLDKGMLYQLDMLCIPPVWILKFVKEANHFKTAEHFGVGKMLDHLKRYFYWSEMGIDVETVVRGCTLHGTSKFTDRKLRLFTLFPIMPCGIYIHGFPWRFFDLPSM